MLRRLLDPLRLMTVLPLRLTRYAAVRVARGTRSWELLVDRALTEPVLLRGWDGARQLREEGAVAERGEPLADEEDGEPVAVREGTVDQTPEVVDITETDLADWAQMPFAEATALARELEPDRLHALLDYERQHGHRPRFEQLLRNRIDIGPDRGTG